MLRLAWFGVFLLQWASPTWSQEYCHYFPLYSESGVSLYVADMKYSTCEELEVCLNWGCDGHGVDDCPSEIGCHYLVNDILSCPLVSNHGGLAPIKADAAIVRGRPGRRLHVSTENGAIFKLTDSLPATASTATGRPYEPQKCATFVPPDGHKLAVRTPNGPICVRIAELKIDYDAIGVAKSEKRRAEFLLGFETDEIPPAENVVSARPLRGSNDRFLGEVTVGERANAKQYLITTKTPLRR